MGSPVAALDADVLVPIVACDFLLTAFDLGLFEPVVSNNVLDEVRHTLVEDFPHLDPTAIDRRVAAMRVALDDHLVDGSTIGVPRTINIKDQHIVGAALLSGATLVVRKTARRAVRRWREDAPQPRSGPGW